MTAGRRTHFASRTDHTNGETGPFSMSAKSIRAVHFWPDDVLDLCRREGFSAFGEFRFTPENPVLRFFFGPRPDTTSPWHESVGPPKTAVLWPLQPMLLSNID